MFWRDSLTPLDKIHAPSLALSRFAQRMAPRGYRIIWVDLEEHHTVGEVVLALLNRLRGYDPGIPPFLAPAEDETADTPPEGLTSATVSARLVQAIHLALRRGRYLLAFDSVEAFGRPETVHHGLPSLIKPADRQYRDRLINRVKSLLQFFRSLLSIPEHVSHPGLVDHLFEPVSDPDVVDHVDWTCAFSIDALSPRHSRAPSERSTHLCVIVGGELNRFVADLRTRAEDPSSRFHKRIAFPVLSASAPPIGPANEPEGHELFSFIRRMQACAGYDQFEQQLRNAHKRKPATSIPDDINHFLNSLRRDGRRPVAAGRPVHSSEAHVARRFRNRRIAFMILSCFRRPRLHASLVSLLSAFWHPEWKCRQKVRKRRLRRLVAFLCDEDVLVRQRIDSGTYWIPRFAHEAMYKLLTDPIRKSLLDNSLAGPSRCNADALLRLSFLTMIHSRIARHYYLHIFHRSHDPGALREYFYHRVSALKYLNVLRCVLRDSQVNSQARADVIGWCLDYWPLLLHRETGGLLTKGARARENGETAADNKTKEKIVRRVFHEIDGLRTKYLLSLRNVLSKEWGTLLSTLSTDAWLNWVEQILDWELPECMALTEQAQTGFLRELESEMVTSPTDQSSRSRVAPGLVATKMALAHSMTQVRATLIDIRTALLHEQGRWLLCCRSTAESMMGLLQQWSGVVARLEGNNMPAHRLELDRTIELLERRLNASADLDRQEGIVELGCFIRNVAAAFCRYAKAGEGTLARATMLFGIDSVREWLRGFFESYQMFFDCIRRIHGDATQTSEALDIGLALLSELRAGLEVSGAAAGAGRIQPQ